MKVLFLFLSLFIMTSLVAELNWQHIYFSGQQINNQRDIRIQAANADPVLLMKDSNTITNTVMPALNDGFDNHQVRVTETSYPYIGFRQDVDTTSVIMPVYYNGINAPALLDMTQAVNDPSGDCAFTQTHLDIVNSYASFSQDTFYFAIINNGSGYPVSSGFTFFAYMAVMINPATANDPQQTVWGLMYTVNVAGIISPGLYRIAGTSTSDMTLLGEIQTQVIPGSNCLLMSCNKADLLADPAFAAWYNDDNPVIGCQILTNKISLTSGTLPADQTKGFDLICKPVSIPVDVSSVPILSNANVIFLPESYIEFHVDYYSPEHYLPVTAQVVIDSVHVFEMTPNSFPDFNGSVHYTSMVNASEINNPEQAVLRFSPDGIVWSEVTLPTTSSQDHTETALPYELIRKAYPNPVAHTLHLEIRKNVPTAKIEIYNLKGQKISSEIIRTNNGKSSLDLSKIVQENASGLYLLKVSAGRQSQVVKVLFR